MTRTGSREGPGAGRAEGTPRDAPGLATHRGRIAWIGERDGWTHPWLTRVAAHASRSRRGRRVIPPSALACPAIFAIPSVGPHPRRWLAHRSRSLRARAMSRRRKHVRNLVDEALPELTEGDEVCRVTELRGGNQVEVRLSPRLSRRAPPPPPVPASPSPSPTASPARLEPPPATRRSRRRTERRR